jgi:cytochrome c-type biogenesis protein CcmH
LPTAAATSTAQILGNVQLSDKSREIVLPTDTVFIFARAVDGPPMPVAVLQRPASDLPLDFLLNDSQAMSDAAKLSNHEQVTVTARISRSGIATDALKNLEAKSEPVIVAENRRLNLIIE